MQRDRLIRNVLWLSASFNIGGAGLFAFPDSSLGQLAGLPPEVPLVYRALVVLFVLLFGGAYGWLAMQPAINRPMLALGAIGKAGAFVMMLVLWLASEASVRGVLAISGDLLFAALFAWWLASTRADIRSASRTA